MKCFAVGKEIIRGASFHLLVYITVNGCRCDLKLGKTSIYSIRLLTQNRYVKLLTQNYWCSASSSDSYPCPGPLAVIVFWTLLPSGVVMKEQHQKYLQLYLRRTNCYVSSFTNSRTFHCSLRSKEYMECFRDSWGAGSGWLWAQQCVRPSNTLHLHPWRLQSFQHQ